MDFRVHGGPNDGELSELGLRREDVLDFSASTNPWGPSESMLAALGKVEVGRYPDSSALAARACLAEYLAVPSERLTLGNGAAELLWTLRAAIPGIERGVLIAEPTFCEFRAACVAGAIAVHEWRARENQDFQIDLEAVSDLAKKLRLGVVYVCCPNTPTGATQPAKRLAQWAAENPQLWIVLDQSFLSLSERFPDLSQPMPSNVICVRSLTKDQGIPGVRVGYLVAAPAIAQAVERLRPAWTVSSYAQAAVVASTTDQVFVQTSREQLLNNRSWLFKALQGIGLAPIPSSAPFLLVRIPHAARMRSALLARHRLLVRDCTSFGLPGYLRLSVRSREALATLVEALKAELAASCR